MKTHFVLPVIHHRDHETSLAQAEIAFEVGADGVFLISHQGRDEMLFEPASAIKQRYPDKSVGLNLLGASALSALHQSVDAGLDMVWADTPGILSTGVTIEATQIGEWLADHAGGLLFFGSVAFKYQPHEPDPARAALAAASLWMVPTTSGPATGMAPDLDKIAAMQQALGGTCSLAVASGMTTENVGDFLSHVSHFLVATGVSKDAHHFDEVLLGQFVQRVRAGVQVMAAT